MSLYFHSFYENYDQKIYHEKPQTVGKICHENIENGNYSTLNRYLQGLPVYSLEYNLMGKIDIYDKDKEYLIERKYKVKKIYDGYKFQLWAQMICMEEMGYKIEKMFIYSLSDNKKYEIEKPKGPELFNLLKIIEKMRNFNLLNFDKSCNPSKCAKCIYAELCNR